MVVVVVVVDGRNASAADAAPKHLLSQPNALFPGTLLGIVVLGAPVSVLDHAEEAEEVAGDADAGEAVLAEGIPLGRGGFAGPESVSPQVYLVSPALSAQGAGVELGFGELRPGRGGRERLDDQGAVRHGAQHGAAGEPREARGRVQAHGGFDVLGESPLVEPGILQSGQRERWRAGGGATRRGGRVRRGGEGCGVGDGHGERMRRAVGDGTAEAKGGGGREARSREPLGGPDELLEVAKGGEIGAEDGLEQVGEAGRIRGREGLERAQGGGGGVRLAVVVARVELAQAGRRRDGRIRLVVALLAHQLHDVLQLDELVLLGSEQTLGVLELAPELVILALQGVLLGLGLLLGGDDHLVGLLEEGGRQVFELLLYLLLLVLDLDARVLLVDDALEQLVLVGLDGAPAHPDIAGEELSLALDLGLELPHLGVGALQVEPGGREGVVERRLVVDGIDELGAQGGYLVVQVGVMRGDGAVAVNGAHGPAPGIGDGAQVVLVEGVAGGPREVRSTRFG